MQSDSHVLPDTLIKQIISLGFGYRPQYQPSTIISAQANALGLKMGSQIDTLGDNQKAVR